jgi:hypothetical protein
MTTAQPAPKGLAARGRRFWRLTTERFDLSDGELEVLTEVCRTLDNLDRLDAAISRDGVTVAGSAGQTVVHPAVTEARGQRALLHRLVAALALPDEDGATVPTAGTLRAKRAASVRWAGHVKDRGA